MPTRWGLFAGTVILVTLAFLALARATTDSFASADERTASERERTRPEEEWVWPAADDHGASTDDESATGASPNDAADGTETTIDSEPTRSERTTRRLSDLDARTLLVDAVISQFLVGVPLVVLTWYAEVPAEALGLAASPLDALLPGTAIGLAVYVANETGALSARKLGIDADERLREMLAPRSAAEWVLLLGVALPLIAGVEEFLFRAALIGGLSAGFGLNAWLLAVLSSIAFGLGHGLQGTGGVLVAGILGFALAAAFVLTGSLWVVVVAHYVVNAMEFVVHEGLGVEFGSG